MYVPYRGPILEKKIRDFDQLYLIEGLPFNKIRKIRQK